MISIIVCYFKNSSIAILKIVAATFWNCRTIWKNCRSLSKNCRAFLKNCGALWKIVVHFEKLSCSFKKLSCTFKKLSCTFKKLSCTFKKLSCIRKNCHAVTTYQGWRGNRPERNHNIVFDRKKQIPATLTRWMRFTIDAKCSKVLALSIG